jgi:hypothetical protein
VTAAKTLHLREGGKEASESAVLECWKPKSRDVLCLSSRMIPSENSEPVYWDPEMHTFVPYGRRRVCTGKAGDQAFVRGGKVWPTSCGLESPLHDMVPFRPAGLLDCVIRSTCYVHVGRRNNAVDQARQKCTPCQDEFSTHIPVTQLAS